MNNNLSDKTTNKPFNRKLHELFGIDLRSLAIFRICIALLIIIDLLDKVTEIRTFYTDEGIIPRTFLINDYSNHYNLSLHLLNGSIFVQTLLFLIAIFLGILLLFGYHTRIATFASWFLMLSLHVRNPIILIGGDELLRMLLFWGIFLPLGACYSIDSALNNIPVNKSPKSILSMGTVAILLQIIILYWISVVFKSRTPEWLDGTAIYYALTQDHYARPLGTYLLNYPQLLTITTHFVYWLETIGPIFLFSPILTGAIRTIMVFIFMCFQLSMGFCIDLNIFPWVSSIAMIPYIPSWFWDTFAKKFLAKNDKSLKIHYNSHYKFTKKILLIAKIFLILPKVEILKAEDKHSIYNDSCPNYLWVVVEEENIMHFKSDALLTLLRASPLIIPIRGLIEWRSIQKLLSIIYEVSSTNLKLLKATTSLFSYTHINLKTLKLTNILAAFFLFYTILWNLWTIDVRYKIPEAFQCIGHLLRLDQWWSLYSPLAKASYWYVIPGRLKDGSEVDLFRFGENVNWSKPDFSKTLYRNRYWQAFLLHIAWNDQAKNIFIPQVSWYLCKCWNEKHIANKQLEKLEIYMIYKITYPNYKFSPPQSQLLWTANCSPG